MAKSKKRKNSEPKKFVFRRNVDLGNLEAEHDRFLLKTFVEKEDYSIMMDMFSTRSILIGRTGIGKSALICKLESEAQNVTRIEPEAMSLQHLSNSTIIRYFNQLGVKLDLFYKVLWKHIFVVELIKLHFKDRNPNSNQVVNWFRERWEGDRSKKIALKYIEEWGDKFWETTEFQIKELEQSLEQRYKIVGGGAVSDIFDYLNVSASAEKESKNSNRILLEAKQKAQSVVNDSQLESLQQLLRYFKEEMFAKTQRKYYIVVDDLDKDWVDVEISYELIKALIDVLKDLRVIKQVKIVIALRSNIEAKIFDQSQSRVQREKYDQLFLELVWSEDELRTMMERRLALLMKDQYTNTTPTLEDILPKQNRNKEEAFQYILDRTQYKPREVLDFFNFCIQEGNGKSKFTWSILTSAEERFSTKRFDALRDEWYENHGDLSVLTKFLIKGFSRFTIGDVHDKASTYFQEAILNEETTKLSLKIQKWFEIFGNNYQPVPIIKKVLHLLYSVGFLGIKSDPTSKPKYVYETYNPISVEDITKKTVFYIHPMYRKSMRVIKKSHKQIREENYGSSDLLDD